MYTFFESRVNEIQQIIPTSVFQVTDDILIEGLDFMRFGERAIILLLDFRVLLFRICRDLLFRISHTASSSWS